MIPVDGPLFVITWTRVPVAALADRNGERVARKARDRAERGLCHGGSTPPFGYELRPSGVDGNGNGGGTLCLVRHEERAELLQDAADRILNGESLYGAVADWNHRGFRTARDAHWRSKTLRQALLNPSAIGMRRNVDRDTGPSSCTRAGDRSWTARRGTGSTRSWRTRAADLPARGRVVRQQAPAGWWPDRVRGSARRSSSASGTVGSIA